MALTFLNPADYNLILEQDYVKVLNLNTFSANSILELQFVHLDGSIDIIKCRHTYNELQIEWFKAGSALNYIKKIEGN